MKRKYQSWGDFLKKRREEKYRSAREFCSRVSVGISYPQYSRYEAGDQLPNLEQALELCKLLSVPVLEGLLEWSRAQVGDFSAKREVDTLLEQIRAGSAGGAALPAPSASGGAIMKAPAGASGPLPVPLDDVIVFNRSHLRLFMTDPVYRDIFTYINSFAPEWIATSEIARAVQLPLEKVDEMTEKLSDLGVILMAGGKCRANKRNFYFPDDADFFDLRNMNLIHNATALMKNLTHDELTSRKAYRGLVTRELTEEQLEEIVARMDEMLSRVVGLPETKNPEKIYSLCVLLGARFDRPNIQSAQNPGVSAGGLTRGEAKAEPVAVESSPA